MLIPFYLQTIMTLSCKMIGGAWQAGQEEYFSCWLLDIVLWLAMSGVFVI